MAIDKQLATESLGNALLAGSAGQVRVSGWASHGYPQPPRAQRAQRRLLSDLC